MIDATQLSQLNAQQLRETVLSLINTMASQAIIEKITHEMAVLKRLKFAAKSEAFKAEQKSLLEESVDADMEALQRELDALQPPAKDQDEKQRPKRQALPENLPRREIHHELQCTTCRWVIFRLAPTTLRLNAVPYLAMKPP